MSKKKILVIGSGFSGIGAIKALEEEGHTPICFEKTSHYGGTWYYREETPVGLPSIMPSTVINHSKEMGALSDFPPDKRYPNYMRHSELLKLFTEYGQKFDCFRHIIYNREVVKVKRSPDYDETGRWNATVKNTETGEITDETFDGVVVGVGQFTYPKMPHYPGMEKYEGTIMHSHDLKRVEAFKDKKVAVVGVGCSGMDAAVDVSNVSSQVYLSTRNGAWVMPRVGMYGLPFDYITLRRFIAIMQSIFGYKFASWYLEKYQLDTKFNHALYNLKPNFHALSKEPVLNDILPAKVISGSIVIRKDIKYFTNKGVLFNGDQEETEVDAVIMATGYEWGFPVLEDDVVVTEEGRINLYKCIYPPQMKHPTLAITGFILPLGPGFPLGELQCRWVAQVFSGKCKLPSEKAMMESIKKRHEENVKRYTPSDKMTVRVDFIQYSDELAVEIGVKPNLWKLLFTDYTLFKALLFGPSLPYQYRLQGPHKWEGARKAILTAYERVRHPLSGDYKARRLERKNQATSAKSYTKYILMLLLMIYFLAMNGNSVKCYLLLLMLPYFITWRGFYKKYFFSLLMLPFFVTWEGFTASYFITLFAPIILASFSSI